MKYKTAEFELEGQPQELLDFLKPRVKVLSEKPQLIQLSTKRKRRSPTAVNYGKLCEDCIKMMVNNKITCRVALEKIRGYSSGEVALKIRQMLRDKGFLEKDNTRIRAAYFITQKAKDHVAYLDELGKPSQALVDQKKLYYDQMRDR